MARTSHIFQAHIHAVPFIHHAPTPCRWRPFQPWTLNSIPQWAVRYGFTPPSKRWNTRPG